MVRVHLVMSQGVGLQLQMKQCSSHAGLSRYVCKVWPISSEVELVQRLLLTLAFTLCFATPVVFAAEVNVSCLACPSVFVVLHYFSSASFCSLWPWAIIDHFKVLFAKQPLQVRRERYGLQVNLEQLSPLRLNLFLVCFSCGSSTRL